MRGRQQKYHEELGVFIGLALSERFHEDIGCYATLEIVSRLKDAPIVQHGIPVYPDHFDGLTLPSSPLTQLRRFEELL